MKPTAFAPTAPGTIETAGGFPAFVPDPLPPRIELGTIAVRMALAQQALGEMKGAARRLQNPYILVRPLQRSEALTSSAMEGTFTTEDDLLLAEAGVNHGPSESTREVNNYLRALNQSLRLVETLPISHRVIKQAHETLLGGLSPQRGAHKRPGEYRRDQNWIGGVTPEAARFVPPPPQAVQQCMDALETYINRERIEVPTPLMDLALVHYQIETIHPFADGNGRVGRMLISLMAVTSGLLDMPALYLSPVLDRNKDEYIDRMYNVSTKGDWEGWLNFFFECIQASCAETIDTIDRLIDLQEKYRLMASEASRSSKLLVLVDGLFERPVITIPDAQEKLGVTYAAAKSLVEKLRELSILAELEGHFPRTFIAYEIVRATRPVQRRKTEQQGDLFGAK